jgi:hypothetical protein
MASMRRAALRAVLVAYALGHVVTATMFLVWPSYFLEGTGARPPWPLSLLQFGSWPPTHAGFLVILGMYDLAVAFALLLAASNPARHAGIVVFAIVLWTLHGGAHGAMILWGDSPAEYWGAVAELWIGVVLLSVLFPRDRRAAAAESGPLLDERFRGSQAAA